MKQKFRLNITISKSKKEGHIRTNKQTKRKKMKKRREIGNNEKEKKKN